MAFRKRFTGRRGGRSFGRRGSFSRSPKAMNTGWVAAVDSLLVSTELSGSWFTDVVFIPLLEVADYAFHESLDPDGVPTKQERCRLLRMVGDLNIQVVAPGVQGAQASWVVVWYIGRFGKEETDNAVGNSLAGGLVNYDPIQTPAPFLFKQQSIIEHHMMVGTSNEQEPAFGEPRRIGQTSRRFDKKMSLPMKDDEELYLILAASIGLSTEEAPFLALNYLVRMLITD